MWTILGFIPPNLAEKYQFFQPEHEIPTSPGLEITGSSKKNEANISEKKFLLLLPS